MSAVRTFSSSPDPLNDSPTFQSPSKPRRSYGARRSLALHGSSPSKQTFQLDVGPQISPRKIRVTVEAGNSDAENTYPSLNSDDGLASPLRARKPPNRRGERTTTTTIPVKGLSDTEGESHLTTPKRGRARPRKSGTPVAAKEKGRASTPTPKRRKARRSIGDLVDGDDIDDTDFVIGSGVELRRGRGRPRARAAQGVSQKSTLAVKHTESIERPVSSPASKKGNGKRKALLLDEVAVLEDENDTGGHDRSSSLETNGALSAIDANSVHSVSRSPTTIDRAHAQDIATVTPQGFWSTSPKGACPSPSLLQGRPLEGLSGRDSPATIPTASEWGSADVDDQYEAGSPNEPNEDESGYIEEFDTIIESEGFSMISVDSVPSLLYHLTPASQNQQEEQSQSTKTQIPTGVQGIDTGKEVLLSPSAGNSNEEALPTRPHDFTLLSVQNMPIDDSFSSIPPQILEAATPAKKPMNSNLLGIRNLQAEDSFSSIAPEILEAATPGRDLRNPAAEETTFQNGETYDDSFSAIPPAVMSAATPAALRQAPFEQYSMIQTSSSFDKPSAPAPYQRVSSSHRSGQSSIASRLPTPEETPSPDDIHNHQETTSGSTAKFISQREAAKGDPSAEYSTRSQIRSSPPVAAPYKETYVGHLLQPGARLHATQTPSIIFSSPALPPPIQSPRGHPESGLTTQQEQKTALSPTVRAGRMLQDILVPSAPRDRSESLGSPFKSPVAERKSSTGVTNTTYVSPQGSVKQPSGLGTAGNLFLNRSQWDILDHASEDDDPFCSKPQISGQATNHSPEVYERPWPSDPRLADLAAEGDSLRSEDAMSWQLEEEVPIIEPMPTATKNISPATGTGNSHESDAADHPGAYDSTEVWEQKWAAERAAVSKQAEAADRNKVITIDSDDETHARDVASGDEDFGLLLDTLNSASPATLPRQAPKNRDHLDRPRRSKIPSPWRKHSKRLMYSDELSHLSSPLPSRISLALNSGKDTSNDIDAADFSAYPIPQSSNLKSRGRESNSLAIAAFLASSPGKAPLPVLTRSSRHITTVTKTGSDNAPSTQSSSVTNDNEPQEFLAPIPQKQNFKPRVRDIKDLESSFASSPTKQPTYGIFGSQLNKWNPFRAENSAPTSTTASAQKQSEAPAPSENDSLLAPAHHPSSKQLSSSPSSSNSAASLPISDEEETLARDRTLKWTETVSLASGQTDGPASPTKSCLRSPLKASSGNSGSRNSSTPSKTVAFVSSSPTPFSPIQEPLSSTTWSRDHWVLLRSIMQRWEPEKQAEWQNSRRHSTRVISDLLGQSTVVRGRKVTVEQWHLEAVDDFRGCVPGWSESTIMKRLVALILGAEARAAGLYTSSGEKVQQAV